MGRSSRGGTYEGNTVLSGQAIHFVAPFKRDFPTGGSQRATAIAEALERRGAQTSWAVAEARVVRRSTQIAACVAGPPLPALSMQLPPVPESADVICACHSYLGPAALDSPGVSWIDFHNIEAVHMVDNAKGKGLSRQLYWRRQSGLMRRFERRMAKAADLVTVTTQLDQLVLERVAGVEAVVVPNLLPTAEAAVFRSMRDRRSQAGVASRLLFIGTLDYVPNVISLDHFLEQSWPSICRAHPQVSLDIVGRCAAADAARWSRAERVAVHGFVSDLEPLLERCCACVLPLEMQAGSSLRVQAFALAGIPMIGSKDAFRSYAHQGMVAETPTRWVEHVSRVLSGGLDDHCRELAETAERLQADEMPFDAVWSRLQR